MNNSNKLTGGRVPPSFAVCFLADCPLADKCLRRLVGENMPDNRLFGPAVYPSARTTDGCTMFREAKKVCAAYGFSRLFADVKYNDLKKLRNEVYSLLEGRRNYYRYNSGEILVMPSMQEDIQNLFNKFGYSEKVVFDNYCDVYEF